MKERLKQDNTIIQDHVKMLNDQMTQLSHHHSEIFKNLSEKNNSLMNESLSMHQTISNLNSNCEQTEVRYDELKLLCNEKEQLVEELLQREQNLQLLNNNHLEEISKLNEYHKNETIHQENVSITTLQQVSTRNIMLEEENQQHLFQMEEISGRNTFQEETITKLEGMMEESRRQSNTTFNRLATITKEFESRETYLIQEIDRLNKASLVPRLQNSLRWAYMIIGLVSARAVTLKLQYEDLDKTIESMELDKEEMNREFSRLISMNEALQLELVESKNDENNIGSLLREMESEIIDNLKDKIELTILKTIIEELQMNEV